MQKYSAARKAYNKAYGQRTNYAAQRKHSKRRREQRIEKLQEIKIARGCIDCGYKEHPAALQFDHVAGQKVATISDMVCYHYNWESILEEIAKCEVRCANCHEIRTWETRHG